MNLSEILSEIKISTPPSNIMDKLLTPYNDGSDDGSTFLDTFLAYNDYNEWYSDNEDESKENMDLAKIFFKLINSGNIWTIRVEDSDDVDITPLLKSYKRIITYGLGYNDVRIILCTF